MNNIDFDIKSFIEQYGIKNLRICWPSKHLSFNSVTMSLMQMGIALVSDSDPESMVMHRIDEVSWKYNPGYKLTMIPDDVYKVTIVDGDVKPIGECNNFAKERPLYVSDFNQMMEAGRGSLYLATEDGYDLLFGVYPEVTSEEETKAENWADNVLNSLPFHQQTV